MIFGQSIRKYCPLSLRLHMLNLMTFMVAILLVIYLIAWNEQLCTLSSVPTNSLLRWIKGEHCIQQAKEHENQGPLIPTAMKALPSINLVYKVEP